MNMVYLAHTDKW